MLLLYFVDIPFAEIEPFVIPCTRTSPCFVVAFAAFSKLSAAAFIRFSTRFPL